MGRRDIVMLPFLAQGHIIPFLALARLLEQKKGFTVTLVSTPLNIKNLRSSLTPNTTIRLAELPFWGVDHGLPPNAENTRDLATTPHLIINLLQATQTLRHPFERLVSDLSKQPGCSSLSIISDLFYNWSAEVAKELGLFHAFYNICGAFGTTLYSSIWLHLPHRVTDSDEFHVPGFPETFRLHRSQLPGMLRDADGTDPWSVFFRRQMSPAVGSFGMLFNTVEKMEVMGLEVLRKKSEIPVWCIGPVLPQLFQSPSSSSRISYTPVEKGSGMSPISCSEWLDLQKPASVLYISFGSENTISASQMMELAMGLEASHTPFIWVVRPPIGFDVTRDFIAEWLPDGFKDRMAERKKGLLVEKWAPQMEILSHKSTGAFLSHCGWNSVLESLSQGVPIIGWPLAAEQFSNSKLMEDELGVCVELARGVEDDITRQEVERVIGLVMGEHGKGVEMKRNANGVAEMIREAVREEGDHKGSSIKALDDFCWTADHHKSLGRQREVN